MLARVNNQTKINLHLSFDKFQKTKDVIYSDGRRETHIFDQNLKQFNPQPSVVIKKERLEDLNIKCGMLGHFKSDIRISCSKEIPAVAGLENRIVNERIKERTSFKY